MKKKKKAKKRKHKKISAEDIQTPKKSGILCAKCIKRIVKEVSRERGK